MTRVRIDLFASLDGYTSAGQTPENTMGGGLGKRLTAAYVARPAPSRSASSAIPAVAVLPASTTPTPPRSLRASAPRSSARPCSACTPSPTIRSGRAGGVRRLRSGPRSTSSPTRHRVRRSRCRAGRCSTSVAPQSKTCSPRRPRPPTAWMCASAVASAPHGEFLPSAGLVVDHLHVMGDRPRSCSAEAIDCGTTWAASNSPTR